MAATVESLVAAIHDSGRRLVLAVTGGGSGAIGSLLTVPGGSRSVVEAVVPYAAAALTDWLGARPEQFCSSRTARAMAMASYLRCGRLDPQASQVVGIGCTSSLASDRPKHGPHRIHAAYQTADATACFRLELTKGLRTRAAEEAIATALVLNAAAEACGVRERLELNLAPGEHLEVDVAIAPSAWRDLLAGTMHKVCTGEPAPSGSPAVVFPGAFNPLHVGHRKIAEIGSQVAGSRTHFELSITNVDKPPLDFIEIRRRVAQFAADQPLWLTRAATFVEKAELFPGATFLVGADTIVRIAEPRYYDGDPAACQAAIERIIAAGCRFLVFGRKADGTFQTLDALSLPRDLSAICREVPAAAFCEDISSTELRAKAHDE